MLRAVLDTNVILAGLRSPRGASFELLRRLRAGHWRLVLSNTTLTEYEEVLKREAALLHLSFLEIDQFLDALCVIAEQFSVSDDWLPVLSDPDDESFVQLAAESRADALATHNLRHFQPARRSGIPVMTPAEFLAMLPARP
jgi:putative PIN family toxin of toxin-antitoxin system